MSGHEGTASDEKWRIEKCRRRPRTWHVYSPCPAEVEYCPDWEFSTGAKAIAFLAEKLGRS